jgi:hypothetical protein
MNARQENRVELLPGLLRFEADSGEKLTYHWINGVGKLANKLVEEFIFILGFLFVYFSVNSLLHPARGQNIFLQAAISVAFFLIGFILVYRGLALALNHSTFLLTGQRLTVHHTPLPFPGASRLDLAYGEIATVEWRKVGHSGRSGYSGGNLATGYTATFDVILKTISGKMVTLVSGIQSREYAFAIASEISNQLKK